MKKYSCWIIFTLIIFQNGFSQMVNIESMRMHTDTVRVAGNAAFSFSYQENNNVSLLVLKSSLASQFKSKSLKDIFMVIGSVDVSKTAGLELSNAAFGHFRYNRKLNRFFRWEVFTQVQYNKVLNVGLRWLNGTGPRFKWITKTNCVGYLGSLYMFEYEETTGSEELVNRNHRLSNYFTFSITIPKIKGEFVTTTYFQPRLDYFEDFRLMQQTSLAFHITSKIKLTTGFNYLYDAFPPNGVTKKALSVDQGIRIDL